MNNFVSEKRQSEIKRQALWTAKTFGEYTSSEFNEKFNPLYFKISNVLSETVNISDKIFLDVMSNFGFSLKNYNYLQDLNLEYIFLEKETKKLVISYGVALRILSNMKNKEVDRRDIDYMESARNYFGVNSKKSNRGEVSDYFSDRDFVESNSYLDFDEMEPVEDESPVDKCLRTDKEFVIGKILRMTREIYNDSQEDVANKALNINQKKLSFIEDGSYVRLYDYLDSLLSIYGLFRSDLDELINLYKKLTMQTFDKHVISYCMKTLILEKILMNDKLTKEACEVIKRRMKVR
jgi:Uncharacterized protein conserved in bacteria